jgi:hypothetical protein
MIPAIINRHIYSACAEEKKLEHFENKPISSHCRNENYALFERCMELHAHLPKKDSWTVCKNTLVNGGEMIHLTYENLMT